MAPDALAITIRPAVPADADGITRVYLESADYHAQLDPERYWKPSAEMTAARYREGRQHPPESVSEAITLVAELDGQVIGFVDARLTQSPDPMHRDFVYCHVVEIAVSRRHQGQGVGGALLRAAEGWGRRQGAEFALLEYLTVNTRAAGFYHATGYHAASINAVKRLS